MTKIQKMEKALKDFVGTIDATGGIRYGADKTSYPVGDEEWIDLADAYETACAALGRKPKVDGTDDPNGTED